jgi:hypothetical protein
MAFRALSIFSSSIVVVLSIIGHDRESKSGIRAKPAGEIFLNAHAAGKPLDEGNTADAAAINAFRPALSGRITINPHGLRDSPAELVERCSAASLACGADFSERHDSSCVAGTAQLRGGKARVSMAVIISRQASLAALFSIFNLDKDASYCRCILACSSSCWRSTSDAAAWFSSGVMVALSYVGHVRPSG